MQNPVDPDMLSKEIRNAIEQTPVIAFIKGTREKPLCGFSATVVDILNLYNVDYNTVNILPHPMIRTKLSEYSNWPTIPQVFVRGEFIGGADIVVELHQSGGLKSILHPAY